MVEELITPKKACSMLGVAASTLRRWAYQGKIRYVRLPSGKLRYYKSDIERILRGEG
ncbi:MAG: helix-turn-helix domain-containing protein [Candidatus Methanospirareceae archaeon]